MPPKTKKRPTGAGLSSAKKARANTAPIFGSNQQILAGMNTVYGGRRILLKATDIYARSRIPEGEETYLFQYHINEVNADRKTATIKFDE